LRYSSLAASSPAGLIGVRVMGRLEHGDEFNQVRKGANANCVHL